MNGPVPLVWPLSYVQSPEARDTVCPMFVGAVIVRGRRLTVRGYREELEIEAPEPLLNDLVTLCDGMTPLVEMSARARHKRHVDELLGLIDHLLEEGALVDAKLALRHALALGRQGSPFGRSAPAALTRTISRRFARTSDESPDLASAWASEDVCVDDAPLAAYFERRTTTKVFGDTVPSAQSLAALLWSLYGIVRQEHERSGMDCPRRTVASAGALQLLQIFVALRRPVGAWLPGVYRVDYPFEKRVRLNRLGGDVAHLPRAFVKPWELAHATGAVFISGDAATAALKYGNRAVPYLYLEAGAVLHNGALTAPSLDMALAIVGSFDEDRVSALCGMGEHMALGAMLFGSFPTASQVEAADSALAPEFTWIDTEHASYQPPFHIGGVRLEGLGGDGTAATYCWGRDVDVDLAHRKALAEAVERTALLEPRNVVHAVMDTLPSVLDPRRLIGYSERQYRSSGFPYEPFDPLQVHGWCQGHWADTNEPTQVLAQLVYAHASLAAQDEHIGPAIAQVTTSGCAAATELSVAKHRALLELIERDAFMRHWLTQTAGQTLTQVELSASLGPRIAALERAGCRVQLQRLRSPWATVILAAAQHPVRGFTVVGCAADISVAQAADRALQEAEGSVFVWLSGHQPDAKGIRQVKSASDHFDLYGQRAHFHRADDVLFGSEGDGIANTVEFPSVPCHESLQALVTRMALTGARPVFVDVTPQRNGLDQGRTPLHVVRALVPGLWPMSFGWNLEPQAMSPVPLRRAFFPHPFS